jgi:hypothetical protein
MAALCNNKSNFSGFKTNSLNAEGGMDFCLSVDWLIDAKIVGHKNNN